MGRLAGQRAESAPAAAGAGPLASRFACAHRNSRGRLIGQRAATGHHIGCCRRRVTRSVIWQSTANSDRANMLIVAAHFVVGAPVMDQADSVNSQQALASRILEHVRNLAP